LLQEWWGSEDALPAAGSEPFEDEGVVEVLMETVREEAKEGNGDASTENLVDIFSALLPAFGELATEDETRAAAAIRRLQDAVAAAAFKQRIRAAMGGAGTAGAAAEAPGSGRSSRSRGRSGSDVTAAQRESARFLAELVPGVTEDLALYLLGECDGDRERAAMRLIENGSPEGMVALREEMEQKQQAQREDDENAEPERFRGEVDSEALARAQRAAIARYSDKAEMLDDSRLQAKGAGNRRRRGGGRRGGGGLSGEVLLQSKNQAAPNDKRRYRNGEVVATRGEKFIVEKPKEFDSGCRGKVYTKGKRGVGFR